MWDMRLSVGVGVSKFVTGHFVIKAIIALGNARYEWRLLLAGYTHYTLCTGVWILIESMKSVLSHVLSFPPPLSLRSTDAGPQSSGNTQWPEGDDIILEQLWLTQYSVFYSNHIAMSFPVSSGHLNPLIMYQQHWSSVYCKSPVYLVLICTLCLLLINLCGGRALQAFTATVMRVCLVWRLCRTNADGLYGCRSGLALTHACLEIVEGAKGSFICKILQYNVCQSNTKLLLAC